MEITVHIPDEIAARICAIDDLDRHVLEAILLEEFRLGRITKPELGRALGLGRIALDGVLKVHEIYESCTAAEIDREVEALANLGV
jgi:hypothetical protein